MDILLTFTGFHDPYALGLIGQEEQPGPILSLVNARPFDYVLLFSTVDTRKRAGATQKALGSLYPQVSVEVRDLPVDDPTDYASLLRALRTHTRDIGDRVRDANYF